MFDVVIIGSGPGGYVAAIRAAQLGLKTAIVEKNQTLGGTCLNVGCIPSKSLLYRTELYEKLKQEGYQAEFDFPSMMHKKEEVVKGLTDSVGALMKNNHIEWIAGEGTFTGPNTLDVGGKTVESKSFIIATGSAPIELPFLPFDEKKVVSSTGALSLSKPPKKLAVIGAGVIGVELASVYRRLGSEVIVLEMLDHICPGLDKQIGREFLKILKKQGIQFQLETKVTPELIQELNPDVTLVAVGRRPYTANLGLEKLNISLDQRGFIEVDSSFRTSHSHIYAIGDVIPGPMLAHKASEEGIAAAELIAGKTPHLNYLTIPGVIYTHPEVATVGLTEEQAKEAGLSLLKGTYPFKGNPRARCQGDLEGLVKILGEEQSGRVIGLHIIGAHASEMILAGQLALQNGTTIEQLAEAPVAHPTLTEAIKEAALSALKRPIH